MNPSAAVTVVTELPRLASRPADAHKGSFGRVLVVAGSRGMSGAAVLCASAALRSGAGLVHLAVPEGILPLVAPGNPCFTTLPLTQDDDGRLAAAAVAKLSGALRAASAGVVGPGLGQSSDLTYLLLTIVENSATPLVLDADALNLAVGHLERLRRCSVALILTPHPGEFSRLTGRSTAEVQERRSELAAQFAGDVGVVLVLKGHGTVVTDGRRLFVNTTGNPGMATGGSGDVLAGLIGALVGQGLEPFAAAQLGVHLHGLAGDLARDSLGETALVASDLLDFLPHAFQVHARIADVRKA